MNGTPLSRNGKKRQKHLMRIGVMVFICLIGASMLLGAGGSSALSAPATAAELRTGTPTGQIPDSFADLVESLSPTVVNIKSVKIEKTGENSAHRFPERPFDDFFKHFFNGPPRIPNPYPRYGAGSGVVIKSDGYILTNNHVVQDATELTVTLNNKEKFAAKVVGADPKTDLAILKIDAEKALPFAHMGDSAALRVGDWVLAIGNPFGLSHTVTSGIVSAKGRIIGAGPYDDFIQTDASINPGNSGGPLFNTKGELIGINTAIIPQGQGIGFAIPINTAKPLIPQLVEKGRVTRGYLGISIQPLSIDLANALNLKDRNGALVADVVPESPADKAGIKRGDVIVSFDNQPVNESHDLPRLVASTQEGRRVMITVIRDGAENSLPVRIGKLNPDMAGRGTWHPSIQKKWGLELKNADPGDSNKMDGRANPEVVVTRVKTGSPADLAGIHTGDVILEINRNPIESVADAAKEMEKATGRESSLLLLVNRDGQKLFVALKG